MSSRLIQFWRKYQQTIVFMIDILCINLAIELAFQIRFSYLTDHFGFSPLPPNVTSRVFIIVHLVGTTVGAVTFYFFELYDRKRFSSSRALLGSFFAFWFSISLTYFSYRYAFSRLTGLLSWFLTTIFVVGWRAMFSLYLETERGRIFKSRPTIIAGRLKDMVEFYQDLQRFSDSGYQVVGFFVKEKTEQTHIDGIPILGHLDDLAQYLRHMNQVEDVIFTQNSVSFSFILHLQSECRERQISLKSVPTKFEVLSSDVQIREIDDIPMIDLMLDSHHGWNMPIKRFMDIFISLLALVLTSPLILATALAVKLTSPGPVLYKQERIGLGGKPFTLYKFRSMIHNAEEKTGPVWASQVNDDRFTPIGRFLRRSSIDELPQLWNVLKGDMSLVGPRPERPHFVKKYRELQYQRLSVKPGLTGLAQVNGRYDLSIEEKIRYDLYYVRRHSLLLDLDILLKTIWITISQKGAY